MPLSVDYCYYIIIITKQRKTYVVEQTCEGTIFKEIALSWVVVFGCSDQFSQEIVTLKVDLYDFCLLYIWPSWHCIMFNIQFYTDVVSFDMLRMLQHN